jgi:hypothetical protein
MAKPTFDLHWYRFWANQTLWKTPRSLTGAMIAAGLEPRVVLLEAAASPTEDASDPAGIIATRSRTA